MLSSCYKLSVSRYATLETDFHRIHNNKYDYSKFVYTKSTDKSIIICPEHGEFSLSANTHLQGKGCVECSREAFSKKCTIPFDAALTRFNEKHNHRYDYTNSHYKSMSQNINIICREHGEFIQQAYAHSKGAGCPKCVGLNRTKEEFIIKANKTHNGVYDYSKFNYVNAYTKSIIICKQHGEFMQSPDKHYKYGCNKCGCERAGSKNSSNLQEFIEKAKIKHNEKYCYNNSVYTPGCKIGITCLVHGIFYQQPSSHLQGHGCPKCALEKTEFAKYNNQKTTLYYICINNMFWKIGLTKQNVSIRFKKEIESGINLEIIHTKVYKNGWEAYLLEQEVLNKTQDYKITKEESPIKGGWSEIRSVDFRDFIL